MTAAPPQAPVAAWFDLYGTLVPTEPLADACEAVAPGRGAELAGLWRRRQLEASWLRSLMGTWQPFDVVTAEALDVAAAELGIETTASLAPLDGAFERLAPRPDAALVLAGLRQAGLLVGVLSNGSSGMIERTLRAAGLDRMVDVVASVDEVGRYKPDPAVYRLAVERTGAPADRIAFVTANGWDAAGAATFGLQVIWLRRDPGEQLPAVGAPRPRIAAWSEVASALGT